MSVIINLNNKLFKCNVELGEWCIASSKQAAYNFMDKFWNDGLIMKETYVDVYLKENPDKTLNDFIEYFFIEEDLNKDFTVPDAGVNHEPLTKKVSEWIDESGSLPSYLCHEKW